MIRTATVVALSVPGRYLSGTEWGPDKVEGSMCFKYKYSYVFTINTQCSQAVPDEGVVTELLALPHTHTHNHATQTHTQQKHLDQ